jgi:hypothetical protein
MVAAMVIAVAARSESVSSRVSLFRVLGKVYSFVIGPGAVVTLLTGVGLMMSTAQPTAGETGSFGTWVMEATGLLAGALVLFAGLPTAIKLARVADLADENGPPPIFDRLRKRLAAVAHTVAVLAVLSMYFGTVVR